MSFSKLRSVVRISKPAFPSNDRVMSETELQSLRDYRRERCANRQTPCQPKAA